MQMRRLMALTGSTAVLVVTAVFALGAQPQQQASSEQEVEAIRQVLEKVIATVNSPEFARAPRERRMELLRPFYRADQSFPRNEQPLFFGPLSEHVSRGVNAHLENMNLNFEWVFRQGMVYGTRIDEMQIEVDNRLAVVLAHTTSGFSTADNRNRYGTRGRATVVFNKMRDGQWRISREHLELYNPSDPGILSKERLEEEIQRFKGQR